MKVYKVDKDFCENCFQTAKKLSQENVWKSNLTFWPKEIRKYIYGSCLTTPVPNELHNILLEELFDYLPKETKQGKVKRYSSHFYIWQPYSGISKHTDYGYAFAATIYLNRFWDINWGGTFLYYNKEVDVNNFELNEKYMYDHENWKVIIPEFATMVLNDSQYMHLVTPIAATCPDLRCTIQIWGSYQ